MNAASPGKLLVLSIGYGQGHHSAAAALAAYYEAAGWSSRIVDICAEAQPVLFRCTQMFYEFCVRRAPWLWGVTYALTDTADWASMVRRPMFAGLLKYTARLLSDWNPDLILCTYPLFAYLLDELKARGLHVPPYAVVVTDAREISRPWMRSSSELVLVPDAGSQRLVMDRYAFGEDKVIAAGFPVKDAFEPNVGRTAPDEHKLKILYGAYRQTQGVINDIAAMLEAFPQLQLTVLAGKRAWLLQRHFRIYGADARLQVLPGSDQMHKLLGETHFYIGKAGAATMFECYASHVPMLVNFTLPGQERGNLELLLEDGAGFHVESTAHLVATLRLLLGNGAAGWHMVCRSISQAGRDDAARLIAEAVRKKFGL